MKQNIFFLLSICTLLLTCSDGDDPIKEVEKPPVETEDPFITLKKSNIDFTNEGGSESILIESNVTWTAKSSAGWCTVTPSSGNKSTGSITLSAPANEDYDTRSCTVTIQSGNITKTITVNQGENLGLLITQDRYELGNEESAIAVEVKANVEFEVEIHDEWITQVETRGLTTSEIAFKVAENDTYGNREGSITIKQKGGNMSSTITIFQSQEDALILTEKDIELTSQAQSVEVEVKTNIDYEIIIPEDAKDWVSHTATRALRTETVVLDITQNKDYDERTAKIVVKDKKTNLQETVTIKQAANLGLIVTPDKYELSNDGGTIEVEVKANVEFDIEIADKWITRVETRGLTKTKLQFQVAKNENYDSREGAITIKQKDGNLSSIIKVYQSQKDAIIISDKTVDLSNEKQAIDVELKTNVEFEVIIPEAAKSWVSYTPTRGLRTETLTLNISENKDYTARSTEVYVKNKKTSLQDTLTINQAANTGLIVTPDKYELSNDGGTIEVEVKANVEFDIEISDSWITRIETRGLTETKLQFQVAKNEGYDNREGTITIKQKGGNLSSTIKVYQSQKDAIILSDKTFDLSNKSQTIDVELKTNVEFELIIPEAAKSWVSFTPTRGLRIETLTLNIAENRDYDARSTEVYVKNKKTNLQDTLTINQAANTGLIVSEDEYELSNDGGIIEVEVKANVEFDIEISDNWITRIETRGLTATKLQFQVAKNGNYDSREGTITIKQKGANLSSTIKVYQSQKDAIIISEKTFDLSSASQAIEVELKTNVEFELIIPEAAKSWVSYTPTRALRTETLTLNITENKSLDERSTEIYVVNKKSDYQEKIIITQKSVVLTEIWIDQMGTLSTILNEIEKNTIEAVIVKGEMNKKDFEVLKNEMPNLTHVDLKDVKCEDNKIPDSAFGGYNDANKHIATIILPHSVSSIGRYAFYNCSGLTCNLNLPNGLKSIGIRAFSGCSGLTGSLKIPNGLTIIEDYTFSGCSGFNGVLTLPDGLIEIGESAFISCRNMKGSLVLPDELNKIGRGAFYNCEKFTGSLILPDKMEVIETYVFKGCSGFDGSLILPEGLREIKSEAFASCYRFTNMLDFPANLKIIGHSAFWGCSGFTGLNLPEGLKEIKYKAFRDCSGFKGSLILPNSLKSIEYRVFFNCKSFDGNLSLPDKLESINMGAFYGCGFTGTLKLPNSLKLISSDAFRGCNGFTGSLILPDNLETIESNVFSGCSGFDGDLILPENLISIGFGAFSYCSGFTGSLNLPSDLIKVNSSAFYNCLGFTGSLTFPDGLITIGDDAFYGCSGFDGSLNLSAGLKIVGRRVFRNCSGITGALILPSDLTTIEREAFYGCSSISSLVLGDKLTVIQDQAFMFCSNISGKVVFPKSLSQIKHQSFYYCSKVKSFRFPHTIPLYFESISILPDGVTIEVPVSAVETYRKARNWSGYNIVGY